jgi:hypothetical protein
MHRMTSFLLFLEAYQQELAMPYEKALSGSSKAYGKICDNAGALCGVDVLLACLTNIRAPTLARGVVQNIGVDPCCRI